MFTRVDNALLTIGKWIMWILYALVYAADADHDHEAASIHALYIALGIGLPLTITLVSLDPPVQWGASASLIGYCLAFCTYVLVGMWSHLNAKSRWGSSFMT